MGLVILILAIWAITGGFFFFYYHFMKAEQEKVRLMEEMLELTQWDDFFPRIRELVSRFSYSILPGFGRERLFDEPESDDSEEYYNFFHYHVVTTLRDRLRLKPFFALATAAVTLVFFVLGVIAVSSIESKLFSLRSSLSFPPLLVMMTAAAVGSIRRAAAVRKQTDLLCGIDEKYARPISSKVSYKNTR